MVSGGTEARTIDDFDRVRANTRRDINERIDRETEERVRRYALASREELSQRIRELEREWDIECVMMLSASALSSLGLALGAGINRRWLLLPGIVLSFLSLHAVQGWCPPLLVLRPLGMRTEREIHVEKYALKALRGDFAGIGSAAGPKTRVQEVLLAARAVSLAEKKAA